MLEILQWEIKTGNCRKDLLKGRESEKTKEKIYIFLRCSKNAFTWNPH